VTISILQNDKEHVNKNRFPMNMAKMVGKSMTKQNFSAGRVFYQKIEKRITVNS